MTCNFEISPLKDRSQVIAEDYYSICLTWWKLINGGLLSPLIWVFPNLQFPTLVYRTLI